MQWDEPGIGRGLFFMSLVAIIFLAILLLMEFGIFSLAIYYIRGRHKEKTPRIPKNAKLNDDVRIEKEKVNEMAAEDMMLTNLVVRNLTKFYGELLAVNELCIAVDWCVFFNNIMHATLKYLIFKDFDIHLVYDEFAWL